MSIDLDSCDLRSEEIAVSDLQMPLIVLNTTKEPSRSNCRALSCNSCKHQSHVFSLISDGEGLTASSRHWVITSWSNMSWCQFSRSVMVLIRSSIASSLAVRMGARQPSIPLANWSQGSSPSMGILPRPGTMSGHVLLSRGDWIITIFSHSEEVACRATSWEWRRVFVYIKWTEKKWEEKNAFRIHLKLVSR